MSAMSIKAQIEQKLIADFAPEFLEVIDESYKHIGHNPDAKQGNTHFKIKIVSNVFSGVSHVQKHKMIFVALDKWMNNPIHALSIQALCPVSF